MAGGVGVGGRVHAGALVPLLAVLLTPVTWRVPACFVAVVVALTMAVTSAIGTLVGRSL